MMNDDVAVAFEHASHAVCSDRALVLTSLDIPHQMVRIEGGIYQLVVPREFAERARFELWQYEQEWRSVVSGPGLKRIPAAAISGVVIGYKADQATEDAVRDWVRRRRRKVSISRAVKRKGAFALDLVPI